MMFIQMRWILFMLAWTSLNASDLRPHINKRMSESVHQALRHNTGKQLYLRSGVPQSAGDAATFPSSGNMPRLRAIQADQVPDSPRGLTRRVPRPRRPVQSKKPIQTSHVAAPELIPPRPAALAPVLAQASHSSVSSINVLASFAGRNRVLVISAPHESDGYYRLMMSLLKPDIYCEMAERHVQVIVMFHQQGEMGGQVRKVSNQGTITVEPLDPGLVPRLMGFLKFEEGKFGMVLLRKTLQVEERYPYPVRLEAVYETVDRTPMRRVEKARQKGFVQRCKAAGLEGQVVQSGGMGTAGFHPQVHDKTAGGNEGEEGTLQPTQRIRQQTATSRTTTERTTTARATKPTTAKPATTTTSTTKPSQPTTTRTTTFLPTTTTAANTTTVILPMTDKHGDLQTQPYWNPAALTTAEPHRQPSTRIRQNDHPNTVTYPSTTFEYTTYDRHKHPIQTDASPFGAETTQGYRRKPGKDRQSKLKNAERQSSNEPVGEDEAGETGKAVPIAKTGKIKPEKGEKKKNPDRPDKPSMRTKAEKKATKASKDADASPHGKNVEKKGMSFEGKDAAEKSTEKQLDPKKLLDTFLAYFERRRRLIVITAPNERERMYVQQRDEYLEQVCDMALRKISIITVFGPTGNSTMRIDHYQMEHDKPMRGLPDSDLINQDLITAFRKGLGMTHNEFYMVLTDFSIKVKQQYEVPIIMKAVFDYIDTFPTRIKEMEQQRKQGVLCKKEDKSRSLENFLSRFRWRRRLFVISTPNDEEWAYQQQLYAMNSQACNLGLRHISVMKLMGKNFEDMGGVLELYPINGTATVERQHLSASLVRDIRNYFQISPEYFSMLLVGKDGNVKSWYPSPMWSMSTIYDLIDSMQLRRQEMAIQLSLGMRCPEDEYGSHDGYHDGYHRGYGY
ncbi:coiled-coil domain-containing protein 80 [Chanos chanos]|uniref:Coiled-coil domain-containing protein 80 n=1 Tax=Chanos chanos TaxID=29144 RepID=A0A6J2W2P1_CHACN|nr:coiled-coil domain-containing protein 80-like [Chanos chanos]